MAKNTLQNTLTVFLQRGKTRLRVLSTLSLPSLQGPFWSGVVAPDKVLSMGLNRVNTLN